MGIDGTESLSHNTNLFGSHIVDIDEQAPAVFVEAILDVGPNFLLTKLFLSFLGHFSCFQLEVV